MGKETAFWEAVVAVAPVLALAIVVEFRTLPWQRIYGFFKVLLLGYMATSLIFLAAAISTSILKLLNWGNPPMFFEKPEDAVLAAAGVIFAAMGILVVPVSMTLLVAAGPAIHTKMRRMQRLHRATDRAFRRRIDGLLHQRHETRLELSEAAFTTPGDLLTNTSVSAFRLHSHRLHRRLRLTEVAYEKWEKASRKRLKKAARRYTVRKATDIIVRRPGKSNPKTPRSHRSPYH